MDSCSSDEEVAEGTGVYLHQTTARELLYFQPGDVLGMLMRLQRSADFSPLLVDEDHTTGFSYSRSGPYENGTSLFEGPTTDRSLLLSLELCECHTTSEVSKYVFKFVLLQVLIMQLQIKGQHIQTVLPSYYPGIYTLHVP